MHVSLSKKRKSHSFAVSLTQMMQSKISKHGESILKHVDIDFQQNTFQSLKDEEKEKVSITQRSTLYGSNRIDRRHFGFMRAFTS